MFRFKAERRIPRQLPGPNVSQTQLNLWFDSQLGWRVLTAERAMIAKSLSRLFGYHILQLGCSERHSLLDESPVGHKICFSSSYQPGEQQAVADNEELPLPADSMDVVLIHHALDFTPDSHRLLREAMRVLRPGGKMLILGFNPISCWGLSRLFRRKTELPWCARFISSRRVLDWLRLLDIHVKSVSLGVHFLPSGYGKILKYADRFEELGNRIGSPFGATYYILGTKQVLPITPIVHRWRPLRPRATILPATENIRAKYH